MFPSAGLVEGSSLKPFWKVLDNTSERAKQNQASSLYTQINT